MSKRSAKMIDEQALADFSIAMRAKLAQKRREGRSGWQNMELQSLWTMLKEHIDKAEDGERSFLDDEQLIDIANISMFLYCRRDEFGNTRRICEKCGYPCTEEEQP